MNLCLFSKPLTRITINLTSKCNLNCRLCPLSGMKKKGILSSNDLEIDFPLSLFKKLVDELCFYDNFRRIPIHISGGEPFLNPEIFEILRYAKERGVFISIYTNGILPLELWPSKLFAFPPDFLMFSIDGLQFEHDQIRGRGNFDKTIKTIGEIQTMKKILRRQHPFIATNTVINKLNINCFDEILNLAEELDIDTLFFHFVQWSNERMIKLRWDEFLLRLDWQDKWSRLIEGLYHPYGNLTDEEINILLQKIDKIKKDSFSNRQIHIFPDLSSKEEIKRWFSDTYGKIDVCENVYNKIRINYDGDVFPACANIFFPFGNLKNQSLKEILESDKARFFFSEIDKNGYFYACQRCCHRAPESITINTIN